MIDQYNRDISYLRISVTDLCNLRCRYCISDNFEKKSHAEILRLEEIENICKVAAENGITKIRLTGGEPLLRKGIINLVEKIKNIDKIKEIAITTNAVLLESMAKDLKSAGADRLNISLDSMEEKTFSMITRGAKLIDVQRGIESAISSGFEGIKINTVLLKGINDNEIPEFVGLSKYGFEVRFIELMPIGNTASYAKKHFMSAQEVLNLCPSLIEEESYDYSSPAKYYKIPGHKYKVGLIRPISCNFCEACNRIRLTADGKLKPCLHSNQEIDVKGVSNDMKAIDKKMKSAIISKPKKHNLENMEYIIRGMSKIGG